MTSVNKSTPPRSLCSGFLRSSERFPDRSALEVDSKVLTYAELRTIGETIAATLQQVDKANNPPLTAVFANRSVTAFAGILAALFRGHGYVPLNRTFPPSRTILMLEQSLCRAVVVDEASAEQLEQLLNGISRSLILLLPDLIDVSMFAARWPQHRFYGAADLVTPSPARFPAVLPGEPLAYLLFTSGSTGAPKGVVLAQRNVLNYVDFVSSRYGITESDRCSQTFDMTFDLSAHDMFVTWENGACLCCPSRKEMIKPDRFISDSGLTTWFSVPSTAQFMRRLNLLRPGAYPKLRLSIFCGEALPMETARDWGLAAPNGVIENIYGPTELTIACTAYRWNPTLSPAECEKGIVPIGEAFEGMDVLVADERFVEVHPGAEGELLMTGPQLCLGYWRDPERTKRAFVQIDGKDGIYYRTGDRVRRPLPGKPMVYLGRMDNQIKILGHRVELGEVEFVVREMSGIDGVVALGWPINSGGADGIEVFMQASDVDTAALREKLKAKLPTYMVPRAIHLLGEFPLNPNGKFDRKALLAILESSP